MPRCDICDKFVFMKLVKHNFVNTKYHSDKVEYYFHKRCWINFKWFINHHDIKEIDNNYDLALELTKVDINTEDY